MDSFRKEAMKLLGDFGTIGITVAGCVVIGFWIGHYIDHNLLNDRYSPWIKMIGLGFGIAAAFKNLYMMTKRKDLK